MLLVRMRPISHFQVANMREYWPFFAAKLHLGALALPTLWASMPSGKAPVLLGVGEPVHTLRNGKGE